MLSPLLMIVFGILTIYNIREQSIRAIPLVLCTRRRRTEGQLARMLCLQVGVHLILVLPFGIIYSMNSFIPSTQTLNIIAIRLIFVTWQQCDYFVSFFLYVLSANEYRQQLIQIFKSVKCSRQEVQYFTPTENVKYHEIRMITVSIQPKSRTNSVCI
jgi:hypothetical protein